MYIYKKKKNPINVEKFRAKSLSGNKERRGWLSVTIVGVSILLTGDDLYRVRDLYNKSPRFPRSATLQRRQALSRDLVICKTKSVNAWLTSRRNNRPSIHRLTLSVPSRHGWKEVEKEWIQGRAGTIDFSPCTFFAITSLCMKCIISIEKKEVSLSSWESRQGNDGEGNLEEKPYIYPVRDRFDIWSIFGFWIYIYIVSSSLNRNLSSSTRRIVPRKKQTGNFWKLIGSGEGGRGRRKKTKKKRRRKKKNRGSS